MLALLDNALLQAASYGIGVVGVAVAFRILRYPDLTADGSFSIGGAVAAALLATGAGWPVAALGAVAAGSLAGLTTAAIHIVARVNRLLSGILTSMVCYSLAFRVLGGRPNVSLLAFSSPYASAARADQDGQWVGLGLHPLSLLLGVVVLGLVCTLVWFVLRSEFGLVLRATGSRPSLVERTGRRPNGYLAVGLSAANGLVGLSGAVVTSRQGFMDVNMGVGIIIVFIAALVLGEELLRRTLNVVASSPLAGRVVAAVIGTLGYYLLYLGILRTSLTGLLPLDIRPTDLRMLSALVVVAVVLIRTRTRAVGEDALSF